MPKETRLRSSARDSLRRYFPADNVRLAHEIVARGLLNSEYEEGVHGQPGHSIPNRIISDCRAVSSWLKRIKIQLSSPPKPLGSRPRYVRRTGRYWPRSVGSNWLIQQGARPVLCAADILESYKMRQIPLPEAALSTSDPVQESILALLRQNGPTHLDTLASQTGFDTPRTMAAIAMLELFSAIQHMGGGIYKTTQ